MRICNICGRTEADAQLAPWGTDDGEFTICIDARSCDAVAWNTEYSHPPPPVDQLLRKMGAPELPGFDVTA